MGRDAGGGGFDSDPAGGAGETVEAECSVAGGAAGARESGGA